MKLPSLKDPLKKVKNALLDPFKKPVCVYCQKELDTKYVIDPIIPTEGPNSDVQRTRPRGAFCLDHFLEEYNKVLQVVPHGFAFIEPNIIDSKLPVRSQSFYYVPDDLKKHGFDQNDIDTVKDILKEGDPNDIMWIPANIVQDSTIQPLFKEENVTFDLLTKNLFMDKLETMLKNAMLPKGGVFLMTVPYNERGIYVYYNYI